MGQDASSALLLYIEDEVLLQEILIAALTDAGLGVQTATTAAEGIAVLESRRTDLRGLITDIDLGPGLNGWDVARRARELINGLPVVYVSGGSPQLWTSQGVPESIMIAKPFASSQVVVGISELINKAGASPT